MPTGAPARAPSKRDTIVALFLEGDGAASAEQLFEAMRERDPRVGLATVYRTLQWMVEAGLARKAELGDGRIHFERGVPRPKQIHLVCDVCHKAWDAAGGEVDGLITRAAEDRGFEVSRTMVEVRGTCEACRASAAAVALDPAAEAVVFRDVLRIAVNDAHAELTFYARIAGKARGPRLRATLSRIAEDIRERVSALEDQLRERLARDPLLESRPTQLFPRATTTSSFIAALAELDRLETDHDLLTVAIRCERGAHRAFRRQHKRVGPVTAQRVLLEAADQQRTRLDHLLREYRALTQDAARDQRAGRSPSPARRRRADRAQP